jgi:site-specific recombinase XerD
MSTNLTVVGAAPNLPAALSPDLTAAVDLAKAEKAVSTRKAYGTDFRLFKAWCEAKGVSSLPASAETVAAFLAAETGNGTKPSTLARRVAAIRYAHKLAHLDTPTDSEAVKATGHPAYGGRSQSTKGSGCSRRGAGNGCAGS